VTETHCMAISAPKHWRLIFLVGVLYALLACTGCAWMRAIDPATGETNWFWLIKTAKPAIDAGIAFLPPPWNWIVGAVFAGTGATTAEVARRSIKNSPPGKTFGPITKPEA